MQSFRLAPVRCPECGAEVRPSLRARIAMLGSFLVRRRGTVIVACLVLASAWGALAEVGRRAAVRKVKSQLGSYQPGWTGHDPPSIDVALTQFVLNPFREEFIVGIRYDEGELDMRFGFTHDGFGFVERQP
jgi:hypothetical protein